MSAETVVLENKPKMMSIVQATKSFVMDGWANVLSGLGTLRADKKMSAAVSYARMSEMEADQLYAGSDVAARLVDLEPEDAIRQWFTFSTKVDGLAQEVDKALDALHAASRLTDTWTWARLYGGAACLLNVDDSKDLSQPLDLDAIREVLSLTVLTCWELQPVEIEENIESKRYGEPVLYALMPRRAATTENGKKPKTDASNIRIHWTRLIPFYGARLPPRLRVSNNYWSESVLNRARDAIRNYEISNDAVATIIQEINQGVFKMKGLGDMLLAGQDDLIQKRLTTIQLARSICRAIIIDADQESFDNVTVNATGIPDMLKVVDRRLVVASKMPHTKILGESPSGLGASGESENDDWNDHISNQQELNLRPAIQYLLEVLLASKKGPSNGKIPDDWTFEFNPLKQQSEKETLENRQSQAKSDDIYIKAQVLSPDEVRQSRFGNGKYSYETQIQHPSAPTELEDDTDPDADA